MLAKIKFSVNQIKWFLFINNSWSAHKAKPIQLIILVFMIWSNRNQFLASILLKALHGSFESISKFRNKNFQIY